MKCALCSYSGDGKNFSNHVRRKHGLRSIDYTIEHLCGGKRQGCLECGRETRYVAFKFKDYCGAHSRLAERHGGMKGGKAAAWNRGLTKHDDARIARQAVAYSGAGNPFFGMRHSASTRAKMSNSRRITRDEFEARIRVRAHEMTMLTSYDEYERRQGQYLDIKCIGCGHEMKRTLETFERGSACPRCFPSSSSKCEREIADFVESLGFTVERNVRHVIPPKELDVFVSGHRFAIEYNGLYVHMLGGHFDAPDRHSHSLKTEMCRANGVRLFHIFSDEWRDKRSLFERMITTRLGIHEATRASRYDVNEVTPVTAKKFLNENHASGFVGAMKHYALTNGYDIKALMSFRVPRHRRYDDSLEVARFATKAGMRIHGAASRLLKRGITLATSIDRTKILSYADLRFGDGLVYERLGFRLDGQTRLDYWLTDGRNRYDRFKFRAQDGISQREIEANAGVFRVYGCGSRRYILDLT